jgi:hypothetical protein
LVLVAIGSAAVIVLVITLIATSGGDDPKRTNTRTTEATQRASLDEALDAVCEPGSFRNGARTGFENSDSGGICASRAERQYLYIGTYSSSYGLMTDTSTGFVTYYAVGTLTDGQTLLFATSGESSTTPLQPLTSLGFTINRGQR